MAFGWHQCMAFRQGLMLVVIFVFTNAMRSSLKHNTDAISQLFTFLASLARFRTRGCLISRLSSLVWAASVASLGPLTVGSVLHLSTALFSKWLGSPLVRSADLQWIAASAGPLLLPSCFFRRLWRCLRGVESRVRSRSAVICAARRALGRLGLQGFAILVVLVGHSAYNGDVV